MKILIIRLSSIGDIVLTSPIVRCTRKAYPDAQIHFLTKKSFTTLMENNPYLDAVKSYTKEAEIVSELKNEEYTLVLDLHKNVRTKRIVKALGTKSVSYNKENIRKWIWVNFKINLMPKKHLVDRYFDSLKELKIVNDEEGVDFFYSSEFILTLADYGLAYKSYTVITVGGTYATKQIPENIILSLIKRLNTPTVLIGAGKEDAQKAEKICVAAGDTSLINLCDKLSIEQSAYIIENAARLITGDTGMMHIASAFDTPIAAVWGNTHPELGMYAYRTNAQGITNHIVPLKCNPCSKLGSSKCPRGHFDCMHKQNIEQIVKN